MHFWGSKAHVDLSFACYNNETREMEIITLYSAFSVKIALFLQRKKPSLYLLMFSS